MRYAIPYATAGMCGFMSHQMVSDGLLIMGVFTAFVGGIATAVTIAWASGA